MPTELKLKQPKVRNIGTMRRGCKDAWEITLNGELLAHILQAEDAPQNFWIEPAMTDDLWRAFPVDDDQPIEVATFDEALQGVRMSVFIHYERFSAMFESGSRHDKWEAKS